jgi:uncharacterized protein DUF4233
VSAGQPPEPAAAPGGEPPPEPGGVRQPPPDPSAVPQASPGTGPVPEPVPPASRLPSPARAVRAVGSAALGVQALVLLLAVAPLARLGGAERGAAIGTVLGLAALALALAGLLRYGWAWRVAFAVPVVLLAAGWLHWSLGALGVVFGLLWSYMWHVRRTVTPPRRG